MADGEVGLNTKDGQSVGVLVLLGVALVLLGGLTVASDRRDIAEVDVMIEEMIRESDERKEKIRSEQIDSVECQSAATPSAMASVMKKQMAAGLTPRLLGDGMVCAWR